MKVEIITNSNIVMKNAPMPIIFWVNRKSYQNAQVRITSVSKWGKTNEKYSLKTQIIRRPHILWTITLL